MAADTNIGDDHDQEPQPSVLPMDLNAFASLSHKQRSQIIDVLGPLYDDMPRPEEPWEEETVLAFDILLQALGRPGHFFD